MLTYRNVKVISESFVVLIACLFVVNSDAATDCTQRALDLLDCADHLATGKIQIYCNDCANRQIRYAQDCLEGEGVDDIKQGIVCYDYILKIFLLI